MAKESNHLLRMTGERGAAQGERAIGKDSRGMWVRARRGWQTREEYESPTLTRW